MTLPFPKLFGNFYGHQKGAAVVEFLLSLPMIVFVFVILHDVGRMILMKNMVADAAAEIADMISERIDKDDLGISSSDGQFGGQTGQQWLLMGEILLTPEKKPNPIYTYYDTNAPIGVEVRASGTDGQYLCYHNRRGRVIPEKEMGWAAGSHQPEVVVGVILNFRLPLLSGPFGMRLLSPSMTLHAVEHRRMRSVVVGEVSHTVVIRPLYLKDTESGNPLCNPPS